MHVLASASDDKRGGGSQSSDYDDGVFVGIVIIHVSNNASLFSCFFF